MANPINPTAQHYIEKIREVCDKVKPLVVIHCITYNHEHYLRDALEGFIMQQTDFPFVAIVHEDVSTDKTASILKEYAENYPNIILPIFEKENQYSKGTLTTVMNEACMTSGAKYIAMCEGDDYWIDPFKLQKQVNIISSLPNVAMVCHNANTFFEETNRYSKFNRNIKKGYLSYKNIVNKWVIPTASILVRREVFEYDDRDIAKIYSGDYRIILISRIFGNIYYLNEIMSVYRLNYSNGSASATYRNKALFVYNEWIKLLDSLVNKSDGEYRKTILKRINTLNRHIKFCIAKKNGDFIGMIKDPIIFFDRLIGRLFHFR